MQFSNFSKRYQSNSGTLQLMDDLGQANSQSNGNGNGNGTSDDDNNSKNKPIYMLGGGNPSHIPEVEALFREQMQQITNDAEQFSHMVGNYDGPQGNSEFIEELAALLSKQYGWPIKAENIALSNGSQSSFALIFNLLAGQHADGSFKKILLPLTPEYIGYADLSLHEKPIFTARRPAIELKEDGFFKYRIDFDQLEIDEDIAAVCVSRPTNPTGNVITDNELQKLADLCKKSDVPLIIDGAYGLPFPSIIFTPATPVWNSNTILCLSLSKLGLPGVRTGIVIADTPLIELIRSANAISSLAPGSVGPSLVTGLLRSNKLIEISENLIKPYYQQRMQAAVDIIQTEMADIPVRIHLPEGALFLWLWFEGMPISSEALYQQLKQLGVYVIAGQHFFPGLEDGQDWPHQQECIRITYSGPIEVVEKGLKIIAKTVKQAFDTA